jgi:hypothetical protein
MKTLKQSELTRFKIIVLLLPSASDMNQQQWVMMSDGHIECDLLGDVPSS